MDLENLSVDFLQTTPARILSEKNSCTSSLVGDHHSGRSSAGLLQSNVLSLLG